MFTAIGSQKVPSPVAGADFSFVPSTTDRVRLLTLTAQLATAVAVANRMPAIAFKGQDGGVFYSADGGVPQLASLTVQYTWSRSGATAIANPIVGGERVGLALPDIWLQPGDTIESITGLISGADQWSGIIWRGLIADSWEEDEQLYAVSQLLRASAG